MDPVKPFRTNESRFDKSTEKTGSRLGSEFSISDFANQQTTLENLTESQLENRGQVKLNYDISEGTLTVSNLGKKTRYTINASSGTKSCMNDPTCASKSWEGPIPPGEYTLKTSDIDDASLARDLGRYLLRREDWGDFRAPVKPTEDTETFGRDGFFLHGGSHAGSAGCIDVGGGLFGNNQTDRLQADMRADKDGIIELTVKP